MSDKEDKAVQKENERLKKENAQLKERNDVLSYGYHKLVNEETKRRILSWKPEKKETTWETHPKEQTQPDGKE